MQYHLTENYQNLFMCSLPKVLWYNETIKTLAPDFKTEPVVYMKGFVQRNKHFKESNELCGLAQKGTANLTLMGIDPTYLSEKYGYKMPTSK